ncbi:MAG: protein BatD [Saprospiraceae bacterium]|nr:protein BatD [Saprospiraceae bacterium]
MGSFSYQPIFQYFNTNTNTFETLKSESVEIKIRKGKENGESDAISDFTNTGERDIETIFASTNFNVGKPNFFGSSIFWLLIALPFIGLFAAIFIKKKRQKMAAINPVLAKMSKADKIAMQRLATAEKYWKTQEESAFYEEVSKALWGYISDKLVIPQAELSKENIRSKLSNTQVNKEDIDTFITVLNTCEMAVFAKLGTDMETVYKDAKSIITTIENTI